MKSYYTKQIIHHDAIYRSLIFSFMDQLVNRQDGTYDQFLYRFNENGEFIYRAIHNKRWGFDEYKQIEMVINDEGVFVDGVKNDNFTKSWLYAVTKFKNNCENQQSMI